jgi:hypothetical protein
MKNRPVTTSDTTARKQAKSVWQKTPYPNLIRYVPSGSYFGRVKVSGKLIRRPGRRIVCDSFTCVMDFHEASLEGPVAV